MPNHNAANTPHAQEQEQSQGSMAERDHARRQRARDTVAETKLQVEWNGDEYVATEWDSAKHMELLDKLDSETGRGMTGQEAARQLTKALKDDPSWLDGLGERARLHDELGHGEERKRDRRRAFDIAMGVLPSKFKGPLPWLNVPNRPILRAIAAWAIELVETGDFAETARLAARLLKWNPNDNQGMRYIRGPAQLRAGQRRGAVRTLEKTAREDPGMRYELGLLRFEEGTFVDAITTLRRALIENPYIAETLLTGETAWPMPLWQGSNIAEYDGACDYANLWRSGWLSNPQAMHFLRWVQTHPRLMVERGQALEPREAALHETSRDEHRRLMDVATSRLKAIDEALSQEVLAEYQLRRNGSYQVPWI